MLAPLLLVASFQSTEIATYTQRTFHDVTFNATIVKKNLAELRKINPEFANTYLFDTIVVRAEEPFKLRLDAAADDTKATYIINGARQQFQVPRLGIRQSTDLSKKPGRRQTLLDFAIPTPSLFTNLYLSKFVRFDRTSGDPIFDLTYPAGLDNSRQRVWIEKARHYIVKREWYGQQGQLRAVFSYEQPVTISGVTIPTQLTVRNSENNVAGVTRYSNVKVNQGIPDTMFKL